MANEILAAYQQAVQNGPEFYTQPLANNPLERSGARKNSVYVGGTWMGDEGKGIVIADINRELARKFGKVYSARVNGGANAGHHMWIDGVEFLTNQLPTAVAQEDATALITRGCVLNPRDAVMEIARTEKTFGNMPGALLIDDRTPLCLDTHRALDTNAGSTGRGIGPAYADFYNRQDITVRQLLESDWKQTLGDHYDIKRKIIAATMKDVMKARGSKTVSEFDIIRLDASLRDLGNKRHFLKYLGEDREVLRKYAFSNMKDFLRMVWQDEDKPVTIEEAQAPGLDPYNGIRPDVTSSGPSAREVHKGTHGVIYGEDISLRLGVTKTVYASVVGSALKKIPGQMTEEEASFYQENFGEWGKTTKRRRDIYHLPVPFMRDFRKGAMWDGLVATHMDAAREGIPIKYITGFTDIRNGKNSGYKNYQDEMDYLEAQYEVEITGWNGNDANKAQALKDLDPNALLAIGFLSEAVAPVMMVRIGGNVGDNISMFESSL